MFKIKQLQNQINKDKSECKKVNGKYTNKCYTHTHTNTLRHKKLIN